VLTTVADMDKVLDFIHSHKGWAAVALLFLAGGFKATGHENISDSILGIGTLLKLGFLPDGPKPKVEAPDA
jgi:hypothetical protein